jgi:hypothetical protein
MKKQLFAAIVLGSLSLSGFAREDLDRLFGAPMDQEIQRMKEITLQSSTSGDANATEGCKERYANFYNKKVLKISLGFGYGDGTPGDLVWDPYTYHSMVKRLLRPCGPSVSLCGFTRDKHNPDLLRKIAFAPTDENNYMIELSLTHSSLTPSQAVNMSIQNAPFQMLRCQLATAKFFGEIANGADVAIYTGHSRDGGGPDFCPPVKTTENHVNYSFYKKQKPGFKLLLESMQAAVDSGKANQVIGLFSCSSQLHFLRKMAKINKDAGYIVTKRTATFHENIMDAFDALDGILAQRCSEGFELSFGARKSSTWRNMFKREF